jgi:hypothetical protein
MARRLLVLMAAVAAFLLPACSETPPPPPASGDGGGRADVRTVFPDTPPPSPDGPLAARLLLSVMDLDLGTVNIGAMATNVVVVTNAGDLASAPLSAMVGPTADFKSTSNCNGRRLGIGETCVVTMQFVPTSVGPKAVTGVVSQAEGATMSRTFTARGTGRLAPDAGMDATREVGGSDGAPDRTPADAPRPDAGADARPDATGQ